MTVGLVLVSHSVRLAEGVAELAGQMVKNNVPILPAGGTDEGDLGTSVDKIFTALQSLASADGALVLLDLGSALLSAEMAVEMLTEEQQQHVRLTYAPLVEGAIAAALECSLGHSLSQVQQVAEQTASVIQLQQLKPVTPSGEGEPLETAVPVAPPASSAGASWQQRELMLTNPSGLHARPASLFVQTAARFKAEIQVSKTQQTKTVNATRILEVLSLAARQGDVLCVQARGDEAEVALNELARLVEANFYETDQPPVAQAQDLSERPSTSSFVSRGTVPTRQEPWTGTGISPGVALGPAFLYNSSGLDLTNLEPHVIEPVQISREQQRLHEALAAASAELRKLNIRVQQQIGKEEAAIFEAQVQMLNDSGFVEAALQTIATEQLEAASALAQEGERQAEMLANLGDPLLAARAVDLRDAVSRAIRHLGRQMGAGQDLSKLAEPVIIVAFDLTPSDTVALNPRTVLGICTIQGGPTSHAAILARSLGIPAIAGLPEALLQQLHTNDQLALDAEQGWLYIEPSEEVRRGFEQRIEAQVKQRVVAQSAARETREPLRIGARDVHFFANVGSEAAAEAARIWGAEGIGLLRTEFLFARSEQLPGEEEQRELYRRVFEAFQGEEQAGGRTIVVRTLDAGADKPLPALNAILGEFVEANPALGLRGIRIQLAHQELLEQQLRAMLRAAGETGCALHIMLPMITTVEELRLCKAIFGRVQLELQEQQLPAPVHVPLGIMVEVPAAAIMSAALAREADFFSIGSNDLTQYTLACDRINPAVADLFPPLQPSVLRLIQQIVEGARQAGKPVAVCGELAGDARVAPILVGLGVEELSMTPTALPTVRKALAGREAGELQALAERACQATTAAEVNQLLA